jgi:hypothetical protein
VSSGRIVATFIAPPQDLMTKRAPRLRFDVPTGKPPPRTRSSEDHQRESRDQDTPAYDPHRLG